MDLTASSLVAFYDQELDDLRAERVNALLLVQSIPEEAPRPAAENDDLKDALIEADSTLQDPGPKYRANNRPHYLTNLLLALRLPYKLTHKTHYEAHASEEGREEDPEECVKQVSPRLLRHEALLNGQDCVFDDSRRQDLPVSPALIIKQLIQEAHRDVDALSVQGDDAQNLLQLQLCLHRLVVAYRRRYVWMRLIEDIDCAAEVAQRAADLLSPHEQLRVVCLHDLASTLLIKAEHMGDWEDLRRAVEAAQRAVDATPNERQRRAACLNILALALMKRYAQKADIKDINAAVRLLREAMSISRLDRRVTDDITIMWNGPAASGNVVGASKRLEPSRTCLGVESLMKVTAQANNFVPLNQTGGGAILRHIVWVRVRTTEQQEVLKIIEQNLGAAQRALDSTPKSLPTWAEWSARLGDVLLCLNEERDHAEDIDNAVEAFQKAVESTPTDSPGRTHRLVDLGWAYIFRNKIDDLENAVQAFQQAVDSTPFYDGSLYLGLGIALGPKGTEKAIEAWEKQVNLTPPDDIDGWAQGLIYLSYIYNCQYGKSYKTKFLDNAIDAAQQAMRAMPPTSAMRPYSFFFLGRLLMERSKQTEETKDISDAIEAYQEAVNITSRYPGGPIAIYELVSALRIKSGRTGKREDVEDFESTLKQAADLHWNYSEAQPWKGYYSFLGSSFVQK